MWQCTGRLIRGALVCALGVVGALAAGSSAVLAQESLDTQRRDYAVAREAIEDGDLELFSQRRRNLDDYPLAIYLDYFALIRAPQKVTSAEALAFLDSSQGTPLPNRFLAAYLRRAGEDRRWADFLTVKPDEPNSVYLKCYYFRAQLSQGNRERAWEGARNLWINGKSQPKECDPLFKAWKGAGQLTDEIVWTRLLNAFEQRQQSLMKYVARNASSDLRPRANTLLAVYRDPSAMRGQSLPAGEAWSRDVVSYGIAYLARYNPATALAYWRDYQRKMSFSEAQVYRAEYAIARQGLFAETASNDDWLEGALGRMNDDELVGIRLRWALSEQDWASLERFLPLLTSAGQEKTAWRYWLAVVAEKRGDTDAARSAFEKLAKERDFHGFMSADRLGIPYAFNHDRPKMREDAAVAALPGIARVEELLFHDETKLAQGEWYTLMQSTTGHEDTVDLMVFASSKGWHRMAIDAATKAEAWDALDQRFPTAYKEVFARHAANRNVTGTELMSIARRESAYYPWAESPVGARGLMQIMPATGRSVAASLKVPHTTARLFEVEHNVTLGSAYYRQLLDRFDGNRVFALPSYNAGPHRVDRWRNKPGEGVPVDLWIETIPYRETRNYVQAVLAYNVVYQYMLGHDQRLLTPVERAAEY